MFTIQNQSAWLEQAILEACSNAESLRAEFVTPEMLLMTICDQPPFQETVEQHEELSQTLEEYIKRYAFPVPEDQGTVWPEPSSHLMSIIACAAEKHIFSSSEFIDIPHVIYAMLEVDGTVVQGLLEQLAGDDEAEFLTTLIDNYEQYEMTDNNDTSEAETTEEEDQPAWMQYVTCLNHEVEKRNPLIGREAELERTIQVLCRKDKNNALHVGDPGVGKTAIAYGLAARIEAGDVPERLRGSKIYMLEAGILVAGTEFRGAMEKRLKSILDGMEQQAGSILYVDEIHQLLGTGQIGNSGLDAADMLKPYLERGALRVMGATTYDEFNLHLQKNKGFTRRFEKIDIAEPSRDDCLKIIEGLRSGYEKFHNVRFTDEALQYAVDASMKYINDRRLPDKALDLIDDAGAWAASHRKSTPGKRQRPIKVDRKMVAKVLAGVCHVDTLAEEKDDVARLLQLKENISKRVFGQDKAVEQVSEAVLMGMAGLQSENKPLASLLFVGPTGVGKTEVARVLADEMDVPLVRFDMSEYSEKYTVSKFIGASSGYVGYEEGGLLVNAIRKTPRCVLLLDEIEKAHPDIYNILLQVMDYAILTDSKGQKADFRHVVIILTTNAGAQYARQAAPGFVRTVTAGEAMLKSVKQTFKPEFINRLTAMTVFNDVDASMAEKILDKKLAELQHLLTVKKVQMTLTDAARKQLLSEGFSPELGGREVERVVAQRLKPLLTRAILFGTLKQGGATTIDYVNNQFIIK